MRRTLWVVPRELLPVVLAAATRTVAARERRRLEGFIRDSGISARPATWLARAEREALAAVEARGEAFTSDITRSVPLLATKLRFGAGRWVTTPERVGARPAPARDGREAGARPAAGHVEQRPVPLGADGGLAGRPGRGARPGGGAGGARAALARRVRPRDRDGRPLVDGLDRAGGARGTRRGAARDGRPRRGDGPRAGRRRRAGRAAGALGGAPLRRSTRRSWAGRSATGTSGRTRRCSSTSTATPARPCGGTGASSAAGASAATARSSTGCSRTSAPTRVAAVEARGRPRHGLDRRRPLLTGVPAAVPARAGVLSTLEPD